MNSFGDRLDWNRVSENKNLNSEILEKYTYKLDWKSVSRNVNLTSKILSKFDNKAYWDADVSPTDGRLYWDTVSENSTMTVELLDEYKIKFIGKEYPKM